MSVLAIDAGTTGVTAVVVTESGEIAAKGYQEFPQHFPRPGWVEHEPEEIWQATLAATTQVLERYDATRLRAVGITNQRETIALWDRETLASPRRAIVWQDRRTAEICERLQAAGHEPRVSEVTGLRLDPYFSGTKLTWLADNEPHTWALVASGRYAVGTIDSYLIARMSRGTWHVTDVSNASRTLLFDLAAGDWSPEMCDLFGVPRDALPDIAPSWGDIARTDPTSFCGLALPVAGIAGDQQSALFGQTCLDAGDSKCTYGTGSFILTNTGAQVPRSSAGLLSTAAWRSPSGEMTYAQEGAIFVTGAAVQWLRDGLQIIDSAEDTARSPPRCPTRATLSSCPRSPAWGHRTGIPTPAARSSASPAGRRAPISCAPRSRRSPSRCATSSRPCRWVTPSAWTAERRPTTCCARSRPTSSASRWSGHG